MNTGFRVVSILLCAAFLLTACAAPAAAPAATAAPAAETPAAEAPATEAPAADPNAVKVWPDPAIAGNLSGNLSPKDDFAAYVNHDWYEKMEIPAGYSAWTRFSQLDLEVKNTVIAMLKSPDESADQQKAAALFASAMDTATRDAAGNSMLMRSFYAVQDVKSLDELSDLLRGDGALSFFTPLLPAGVGPDLKNSTVNVAQVSVPQLSLEDAAEYTQMTEQGKRFKAANEAYFKALLTHNGVDEATADAMIEAAFAWETQLAAGNYPLATSYRDDYYTLTYNEYTPEAFFALAPNFPVQVFLQNTGLGDVKRYIVTEPKSIENLNAVYTEENLPGIKAYLMINLLSSMAVYGDSFSVDAHTAWSNAKYGSSGVKPLEEQAYDVCNATLGELLGKIYAAKYFNDASKADITGMVQEIVAVYKARLSAADWLTEATWKTAIEKLDALTLRIGYPTSYVFDWDAVDVTADNPLIENIMNLTVLLTAQQNAKADQPVNKELWGMSAHTVNAYYDPTDNSINFPAGILQTPFYDASASRSANLGGIGAVIAHEITHAFDTTGSQFDKDGNMNNWWTDEDRAAFKARTDKVAARYAAIEVIDGEHVRGDLTIGETVADLGAIACTLGIMRELDGADFDEYFRAFTRIWAERITPEMRVYRLANDPHAPGYLRANVTLQQNQEFYDTYDVVAGDFLYTAPEDRLIVW